MVLGSCIVFGFILGHVIVESSKLLKNEKKKKKEEKSSSGTGTVCCQDEGTFSISFSLYVRLSKTSRTGVFFL